MTAPTLLLFQETNDKLGPWKEVVDYRQEQSAVDFGPDTTKAQNEFSPTTKEEKLTTPVEMDDDNNFPAFFRDPSKYEPYLEGLMKSLSKRETALGRYNHVAALTYASLGNAYRNIQEPRAVVMYRAQFRIQIILYGTKTNGNIAGPLRDLLLARGLTTSQIGGIQKDLFLSTRYEMEGDWFRRYGRRQQAFFQYHNAARLEELSFGRDNPDLAYLWRKMACLAAIKNNHKNKDYSDDEVDENEGGDYTSPLLLDWDEADRLGNVWMRGQGRKLLSSGICALIRRGDHYFETLLYAHAVGEYYKASSTMLKGIPWPYGLPSAGNSKQKKSKSSYNHNGIKSRREQHHHQHANFDNTPRRGNVAAELQDFLKQSSGPTTSPVVQQQHPNVPSDALSFSIHSLVESNENKKEKNAPPTNQQLESSHDFSLIEDLAPVMVSTPNAEPKTMPPSSNSSLVSVLSDITRTRPKQAMSPTMVMIQDEKRPKKDTTKKDKPKTVSSSSIFVRRGPRSSSSLPTFRRSSTRTMEGKDDHEEQETKKPKSDSYLSKIASRTRKAASKTTKIAKRQIKKSATSLRDHISKASSLEGSSRRSRNRTIPVPNDENSKSPSKPKSNSGRKEESSSITYSMMASPPMTPFPAKSLGCKFAEDQQLPTLDPPSEDATSQQQQAESSIDNSILVWSEKGSESQRSGPLGDFFMSRQASAKQKKIVSTSSSNVMSTLSSPNGKTKTSDETEKADNRTTTSTLPQQQQQQQQQHTTTTADNTPTTIILLAAKSVEEILGEIQSITAMLQRKVVRLHHKLALEKGGWMSSSLSSSSSSQHHSVRFMAKGSKDLYIEIERLFAKCEDLLKRGFEQLLIVDPQQQQQHDQSTTVLAFEDYHHAFSMEKAFLEELRRKLEKMVSTTTTTTVETKKDK